MADDLRLIIEIFSPIRQQDAPSPPLRIQLPFSIFSWLSRFYNKNVEAGIFIGLGCLFIRRSEGQTVFLARAAQEHKQNAAKRFCFVELKNP